MKYQQVLEYLFMQGPSLPPHEATERVMEALKCDKRTAREFNRRMVDDGFMHLDWKGQVVIILDTQGDAPEWTL